MTVVVALLWMPETMGKSLEEIDASFKKGSRSAVANGGVVELGAPVVENLKDLNEAELKHDMKVTSRVVVDSPSSSSSVSLS